MSCGPLGMDSGALGLLLFLIENAIDGVGLVIRDQQRTVWEFLHIHWPAEDFIAF